MLPRLEFPELQHGAGEVRLGRRLLEVDGLTLSSAPGHGGPGLTCSVIMFQSLVTLLLQCYTLVILLLYSCYTLDTLLIHSS